MTVDASGKSLKSVPGAIEQFSNVRYIDFFNNLLTEIPIQMQKLENLDELHLEGNEVGKNLVSLERKLHLS